VAYLPSLLVEESQVQQGESIDKTLGNELIIAPRPYFILIAMVF